MKNLVNIIVFFAIIPLLGGSCFAQCEARCETAFKFVMSHEDKNLIGIVVKDSRGYSRFGINNRAHPEAIKAGFYKMSKDKALTYAQNLFYTQYWKRMNCDSIVDQRLTFKLADLSYNIGPIRATILLQRALNVMGANLLAKGYFGEETLEAVNNLPAPAVTVLTEVEAAKFYNKLSYKYPTLRAWKKIWLERLYEEV